MYTSPIIESLTQIAMDLHSIEQHCYLCAKLKMKTPAPVIVQKSLN